MKRSEYEEPTFAESFLHRADQLFSMAKLRLDLAAARQRHDRALLQLGEKMYELSQHSTNESINTKELAYELEKVQVTRNDCDRLRAQIEVYKQQFHA